MKQIEPRNRAHGVRPKCATCGGYHLPWEPHHRDGFNDKKPPRGPKRPGPPRGRLPGSAGAELEDAES
jgi:hypothetical protein